MNNEGLTLDAARENVAKVAAGQAGNVTDRWILHNLNETIGKVTENLTSSNSVWLVTFSTTSSGMSLRTGMLS